MIVRVFSVLLILGIVTGCSVKGGTMAPVEDRTGRSNEAANYGNQVVEAEADAADTATTQAYKAPPVTSPVTAPQPPAPTTQPTKSSSAVNSLVSVADAKIKGGQYQQAAASLERALRHDPKNAKVWSRLAEVRLLEQDYAQAEITALKSNALAAGDKPLMSGNWRVISKSRRLRGDSVGADEAEARAYQLSR